MLSFGSHFLSFFKILEILQSVENVQLKYLFILKP